MFEILDSCHRFFVLFCVMSVFALAALAQSTNATLSGSVVDSNGAAIPAAKIVVLNPATGIERRGVTDGQGVFVVPLLPPANYTVKVFSDGFTPAEIPNVILNVGDNRSLLISLKVGQIGAAVEVAPETSLMNESSAVSTVVDRQFVANIPLNGRSFQSLLTLTPGVVTSPSGNASQGRYSVNGQRSDANAFSVDGVSANVFALPALVSGPQSGGNLPALTALGTTQTMVSVDAMEEFRVQTSTYSAEYGRQPGGQISISTRSGTNSFHGVLFDYIRNDMFDANDWFANRNRQARPPEKQNDFGGTLGGPISIPGFYNGRNRTFFFFSYEGLRLRLPQFLLANVPTATLRQNAPTGLRPFLNAFPIANGRDLGNGMAEFSTTYSDPSSLDATSLRIDHTIGSNWTVFGRYNSVPSSSLTRGLSSMVVLKQTVRSVTLGLTGAFSARSSNELRLNYTRNDGRSSVESRDFSGATPVFISSAIPSPYSTSGNAAFSINLLFPGQTTNVTPSVTLIDGNIQNQRQFNIVDNFSFKAGDHRLKFGLDFRQLSPFSAANIYRVDLIYSTQQGVLNNSATGSFLANTGSRPIFKNFSAYAQDSWKVTRKLTLDLGLRWELNPAPREANRNDPLAVDQIENLATMQLAPHGVDLWATTYNNFAPRFGISYQLRSTSGRETILRGGFGVFYDTGNEQGSRGFDNYPFRATATRTGIAVPLSSTQGSPPVLPNVSSLTPPYGTLAVLDPKLKLPYTLQWNLAVQQSLGNQQVLTLMYVGAAGRRLLQGRQFSLAAINPKFTTVILTTNNATSDYNALQAQFQRRLSHGLQALVSYTWSHALDFDSVDNGTLLPVRGNAGFDVRHNFAAALTYDIPAPSSRLLKTILGNWSIDTTFSARTAFPVDITGTAFVDAATGQRVAARANLVEGVPVYIYDPHLPGGRKINRAAFTVPATGRLGTLGRNVVRGLGFWQQDLALRRQFGVTERIKLQFRAEAFNLYNHPNFGAIQTTLSAANFGEATNMLNKQFSGSGQLNSIYQIGGPRSFQFALKIVF